MPIQPQSRQCSSKHSIIENASVLAQPSIRTEWASRSSGIGWISASPAVDIDIHCSQTISLRGMLGLIIGPFFHPKADEETHRLIPLH
jgi:hypothetical protein